MFFFSDSIYNSCKIAGLKDYYMVLKDHLYFELLDANGLPSYE